MINTDLVVFELYEVATLSNGDQWVKIIATPEILEMRSFINRMKSNGVSMDKYKIQKIKYTGMDIE